MESTSGVASGGAADRALPVLLLLTAALLPLLLAALLVLQAARLLAALLSLLAALRALRQELPGLVARPLLGDLAHPLAELL